jgi:hypothetical protein
MQTCSVLRTIRNWQFFSQNPLTETRSPMQHDPRQTFGSLLDAHVNHINKFKEHVQLMAHAATDDGLKVFFNHLLEEEDEHLEAVQAMKEQLSQLPAVPAINLPSASTEESAASLDHDGHYARRDQNILTVGSLFGVRQ